jgi:glycosyltransferase involved in cell wall biosynthesis
MISVIVPTYNQSRYLAQAIESVWAQDLEDIEIVVVDDGSTDDTDAVLSGMRRDPRLRCFRQQNQGPAAARNRGIRESRGELIAFLDSDDCWQPGKLKAQLAALERTGRRFSYTGSQIIDASGAVLAHQPAAEDDGKFSQLIWGNRFSTPTVLVQRSLLDECGWFDESLRTGEDWDLWLRFSSRGPGACVPEPLVSVHGTQRWQADPLQLDALEHSINKVLIRMFELVAARPELAALTSKKGQVRSWHLAVLAKSYLHARQFGRSFSAAIRSLLNSPRGLLYLTPFDHRPAGVISERTLSPTVDAMGESSLPSQSTSAGASVSVVIRTFNRAAMLRNALDSVLAQTLPPDEIIVVDDGSTDQTPQVMADYVKAHKSIRYLQLKQNVGMDRAGRFGVEESSGDFVAFLDSDDVWRPRHLLACLTQIGKNPGAVMAFSGYGLMNADGQGLVAEVREPGASRPAFASLLRKQVVVQPTRSVVSRRAIAAIGGLPPTVAGDWILSVLISAKFPNGVVRTPESTAVFRIHGSQSYGRPSAMRDSLLEATDYIFTHLPDRYRSLKTQIVAINLLHSAVFLWQAGETAEAWRSMSRAVALYPRSLVTKDFWRAFLRLVIPPSMGRLVRGWKRSLQERRARNSATAPAATKTA